MTEKEAYERIGIYVVCGSLNTPDGQLIEYSEKDILKDLDTLKELVDKATPKKVFINDNDCFCPNCTSSLVDVRKDAYKQFISKYCTYCGQALDWGNEQ